MPRKPQGFGRCHNPAAAHAAFKGVAADDVEVARAAGVAVCHHPAAVDNLKKSRLPGDFVPRPARILESSMEFAPATAVSTSHDLWSGGSCDPLRRRNSDDPRACGTLGADVGMPTVNRCDLWCAGYGGTSAQHFPRLTRNGKAAQATFFLRHAADLAAAAKGSPEPCDCTLICEYPKVGLMPQRSAA